MHVDVHGLKKTFGTTTALDIPELHIAPGEIVGLVGSNGAGKTTFLRLVLNLIEPSAGAVYLDGRNVAEHEDWKRHTGSYLDRTYLIDYLTADEYFDFIGSLYGLSPQETRAALQPLQAFYPDEPLGRTTRFIRDLSMGNAKKIGIMAALFVRPRLLLLDEPFANLDPPSQIRLKQLLRVLHAAHGTTMIISSHDLLHVTEVCHRITLLERGRIVRDKATSPDTLHELEKYFTS
ncbi:ABC transporter ATP-binding protein [Rhodocaloribacter litoris]|uniref:ABC transporter ATP-binding protein n=1 Tax=Rhodocaloribacter litoris TaxID=2558931 RepID=UPI00142237F0|nr:ABC transporter ATP-binding protein [Rhodocaloribacter litoris]QXD16391.1 ABC transporter ATP-binding protein [Rhodocaloribacter litoris]